MQRKIIRAMVLPALIFSMIFSPMSVFASQKYTFTTIEGKKVTVGDGRKAIVIFSRLPDSDTVSTLRSIARSAAFGDVTLIFQNLYNEDPEGLGDVISEEHNINICDGDGDGLLWEIVQQHNPECNSVSFPLSVCFDEKGNILSYEEGLNTAMNFVKILQLEDKVDYTKEPFSVYIDMECNYDYALEVVRLTNIERRKNGCKALRADADLFESAMQRAAESIFYFSHTRPDDTSCFTALPDDCNGSAGENIAAGYMTPEAVVEGWMNSPGHRANILTKSFNCIGVGSTVSESGRPSWVQMFCSCEEADSDVPSGKIKKTFEIRAFSEKTDITLEGGETEFSSKDIGKSVALVARNANIEIGCREEINAESFIFTSSDTRVAVVDEKGVVTLKGAGKAVITATSVNNRAKKFTREIVVSADAVQSHEHYYVEACITSGDDIYIIRQCTYCNMFYRTEIPTGDVDFSGSVTASDARFVLRVSVGLQNIEAGSVKEKLADIDADGKISATDARKILRISVGLE